MRSSSTNSLDCERADLRAIVALRLPCRITAWCRATAGDVQHAAACNVDSVHLSYPVSPVLLDALGKDEAWILNGLPAAIRQARAQFRLVSVGAQDASRCRPELVTRFVLLAQCAGACRVRIADTVGIWSPLNAWRCFRQLREEVGESISLEFHGHNDLGMATANTVAAIEGGADAASVTVSGWGRVRVMPRSRRWYWRSVIPRGGKRASTQLAWPRSATLWRAHRGGPFRQPSP